MIKFEVRDAVGGWVVSYWNGPEYIEEVYTDQNELNERLPELVAEMEVKECQP